MLMVHIWCVGVSVGHRLMGVLVTMAFRQTQHHSRQHHNSARQHQQSRRAVPETEGHGSTDEGRESKHRACARRAKRPLGKKVKAQTQAVASGSHGEKS